MFAFPGVPTLNIIQGKATLHGQVSHKAILHETSLQGNSFLDKCFAIYKAVAGFNFCTKWLRIKMCFTLQKAGALGLSPDQVYTKLNCIVVGEEASKWVKMASVSASPCP